VYRCCRGDSVCVFLLSSPGERKRGIGGKTSSTTAAILLYYLVRDVTRRGRKRHTASTPMSCVLYESVWAACHMFASVCATARAGENTIPGPRCFRFLEKRVVSTALASGPGDLNLASGVRFAGLRTREPAESIDSRHDDELARNVFFRVQTANS